ncbi:MAG: HAD family phosphatase [Candidatus Micrarchaeaceae archaeon]
MTENQKIRLVMSDVGGVLIDHDEERHYRYLAEFLGVSAADLIPLGSKFARQLERKEISMREVEETLSDRFGIPMSKVRGSWSKTFRQSVKVREDMVELLPKLEKTGIKIAITTNTNFSDFGSLYRKGGPLHELKEKYPIFASCYINFAKPDPKYYEYVLKRMNVPPEETVFIDDKLTYIVGAEGLKIKTILFKDYNQLVRDLYRLGIEVSK